MFSRSSLRVSRFIAVSCVFLMALRGSAGEIHPFEQRELWQFEDPAAWEWQGTGAETVLVLRRPSHFKPKVRRPFNLAWWNTAPITSFTLEGEFQLGVFNKGNNDLCIAFGQQDDSAFCYAHLGETADGAHLQLHEVNHADRRPYTTNRVKTLPWQPGAWHKVRLDHDPATGLTKVWFDGQPVLEGTSKAFAGGRIGLGSFDDLGSFRHIAVTTPAKGRPPADHAPATEPSAAKGQ